jgi:hypothetical protein
MVCSYLGERGRADVSSTAHNVAILVATLDTDQVSLILDPDNTVISTKQTPTRGTTVQ